MSAIPRNPSAKPGKTAQDFTALVDAVRRVHDECAAAVNRTVNTTLTLRNWLIGGYIHHYELHGADRAQYGERLMDRLADALRSYKIPATDRQRLYAYMSFYRTYPQIAQVVPQGLPAFDTADTIEIFRSVTGKTDSSGEESEIVRSATGQLQLSAEKLLGSLSYTHLEQLTALDTPLKRAFYEIECIRGNWSVRTLKRQIASLYYERSGLSVDKEKLADLVHATAEKAEPKLAIRDPYIFEFLGLKASEAVSESNLEDALLDNLHEFLMELGHGFCFEARQKSIVIGKTRGFVDLVFYHRILKCHVLIELKVDTFTHEHLGQLNTYVSWYRKHMMTEGDNPPVGLLLCTQKDHILVEYATANMDNRLFVSKYQLELPKKEELERFLQDKRREISEG
jgi:predicted nuclease of restriction endonuclease-like (RecB) superfamily